MARDTFLKQWMQGKIPALQGPAKHHEFGLYVPPMLQTLEDLNARDIVDFQADEGANSVAFCQSGPDRHATFVLIGTEDDPQGLARYQTEEITREAQEAGLVRLVTDISAVAPNSADVILFNIILGCLGSVENIDEILAASKNVVRPDGYAFVTVPNPDGENFSSYKCTNLPPDRRHGAQYDFQMAGQSDVFRNLYLTDQGLTAAFNRHGFELEWIMPVADRAYEGFASEKPAFYQHVYHKFVLP